MPNVYLKIVDFSIPSGSTHLNTDWELSDDVSFTNIIWSSIGDTVDLIEKVVSLSTVPGNLYARARINLDTGTLGYSPSVTVISSDVSSPVITIQGEPYNIPALPTFTTSNFSSTLTGNTHQSTDWIIVDSTGTTIESSIGDTTNLTSYTLSTNLVEGNGYIVYVRHNGTNSNSGFTSKYFTSLSNSNLSNIQPPTITIQGEPNNVPTGPQITGSAFTVISGTDTHISTDWIIIDIVSGSQIWSSIGDTVNLTSITVPPGTLVNNTEYIIKVKYNGNNSNSGFTSKTFKTIGISTNNIIIVGSDVNTIKTPTIIEEIFIGYRKYTMSVFETLSGASTEKGNEWFLLDVTNNTIVEHIINKPSVDYILKKSLLVNGYSYRVLGRYLGDNIVSDFGIKDFTSTVRIYTDTWTQVANYPISITKHAQSTLLDGRVLVVGGEDSNGSNVNVCYIYDPNLDTWTQVSNVPNYNVLNSPRALTTLQDGRVLLIVDSNTTYIYDPVTNIWTTAAVSGLSNNISISTLHNGEVLGIKQAVSNSETRIYNPTTNSWRIVANPIVTNLDNQVSITLASGNVAMIGSDSSGANTTYNSIYNPNIDSWNNANNLPIVGKLLYHSMSLLDNTDVFLVGGGSDILTPSDICLKWNENNDTWTTLANYPITILNHTQSTLLDGRVLVVGGYSSGNGVVNTCYIYS